MQDSELTLLIDRFMRRIHFALQLKGPSFDTEKVGPGGGIILLTLAELGHPSLHELTKQVARDKSQMTRTIRSLETKGLVERKPSPDDARVTLVSLTQAGERVVDTLKEVVSETINDILSPISKSEEQVLRELLERALGEKTSG